MRINPLAIIVPVSPAADNKNIVRLSVWRTVTELLMPKLGADFSRFEPAASAWGQRLDRPFGVVLGREDPALFLYCCAAAKSMQQQMIKRHMAAFMENIEPLAKNEQSGFAVYAMEVKGDEKEVNAHLVWHLAMIAGDIQPDCGIYFAEEKESYVSDALEKKVFGHVERYAVCVVNLFEKEA